MIDRNRKLPRTKGMPPRCLAIQDLSCVGRCALAVVIPVLAACGVQTIALPTAIFSNHLAFSKYEMTDFSQHMVPFMDAWERNGIGFETIYSGFLASAEQIALVEDALDRYATPATRIVVDPAMADVGELYSIYDEEMVAAMRHLVYRATLTTPNYTEACMLTAQPYHEGAVDTADLRKMAGILAADGPGTIVITSVPLEGGKKGNYVYLGETAEESLLVYDEVPIRTVGTGDLFSAALIGGLEAGLSVVAATASAGRFVSAAVQRMVALGADDRYGVPFEQELPNLMREVLR